MLWGQSGDDQLAGSGGRDFLTGGTGADVFLFRAITDSVVGALRDQILDFEQGLDVIDLGPVVPGAFQFRGTSSFSATGAPELRLQETVNGATIMQLDTDGNGAANGEIRVANVTGMTENDFIL